MELASPTTALSPTVRHLICSVGCAKKVAREHENLQVEHETDDPFLVFLTSNGNGELKLDLVASVLPAVDITADYYEKAVGALAPVFAQCQQVMVSLSDSHVQSCLLPRLQWTHSEKVFCDCLEMLREQPEDGGSKDVLVLLLISAVLERALGNVCILQGVPCPSMLKDLLVVDEMADILGDSVMQTLRVVIGPPTSLNLRNVAWHGFLGDDELSRRYCSFLVFLAASIGDILTGKSIVTIPQRSYFTWSPDVKRKMLNVSQSSGFAEVSVTMESLRKLLTECLLIQPHTQKQWQLVFRQYSQGRFGYCLSLLLPLFEHCLRRVFATMNACLERVLTAQSSEFYTTFNEMLEQTLPDGTPNQLPPFLTVPCMDLLQDLLFYPEGPRIRDHLSHGEIDFAAVGQDVVDPFLCVLVFLAHRLQKEQSSLSVSCFEDVVAKVNSYRSVFHPVAILQQKFAGLLCQLEKTDSCIHLSADLDLLAETDGPSKLCEDNPLLTKTRGHIVSLLQFCHWSRACSVSKDDLSDGFHMQLEPLRKLSEEYIPTLFRWQQFEVDSDRPGTMRESEFVGLLVRIIEECTTAVEQVQQSVQKRQQQLLAKELRSRQRENLKKLLSSVPCLQMLVAVVAVLVGWNMQHLRDFSSLSPDSCRKIQKHLKLTLQHCENVRTLTSSEKNKWTESVELLISLLPKCQQFLVQWHQQSQ